MYKQVYSFNIHYSPISFSVFIRTAKVGKNVKKESVTLKNISD